ncbi:hypothetical protein B0H11DRAFT_1988910 [Mycena galericulata]|nr:hypothetical protein B0H11DRAFT_1988910 [Mycena galericulata]
MDEATSGGTDGVASGGSSEDGDFPLSLVDVPILSVPEVVPSPHVVHRFWKKVAELTTRCHDADNQWVGGQEVRAWNTANRQPCSRCSHAKAKRICIIEEHNASCKTCRSLKIGCDRKTQFIFEMTKDKFFPTYEQFLKVFHKREPGRLKRLKQKSVESSINCNPASETPEYRGADCSHAAALRSLQSEVEGLRRREVELLAINSAQAADCRRGMFFLGAVSAHVYNMDRASHVLLEQLAAIQNHSDSSQVTSQRAMETATNLKHEIQTVKDLLVPSWRV